MEAEIGLLLAHLSLKFQADEGSLGLPGIQTDGVLVVVKPVSVGVLIGGEVDEVEEVDEGPEGDDELILQEGDVLGRSLVIPILVTAVPPPSC